MIRYLTISEILKFHERTIATSGGTHGLRDQAALESAIAQPRMTFGGTDLYPSLAEKAGALGHALICNHPFIDGNKRIGHVAMETFLVINGWEIELPVDDQEAFILAVASGQVERVEMSLWIQDHIKPFTL